MLSVMSPSYEFASLQLPRATRGTSTRIRRIGDAPPSKVAPHPVARRPPPTVPSAVASVASVVPAALVVSSQTAASWSKVELSQSG